MLSTIFSHPNRPSGMSNGITLVPNQFSDLLSIHFICLALNEKDDLTNVHLIINIGIRFLERL